MFHFLYLEWMELTPTIPLQNRVRIRRHFPIYPGELVMFIRNPSTRHDSWFFVAILVVKMRGFGIPVDASKVWQPIYRWFETNSRKLEMMWGYLRPYLRVFCLIPIPSKRYCSMFYFPNDGMNHGILNQNFGWLRELFGSIHTTPKLIEALKTWYQKEMILPFLFLGFNLGCSVSSSFALREGINDGNRQPLCW